jgi:hypothetical protein
MFQDWIRKQPNAGLNTEVVAGAMPSKQTARRRGRLGRSNVQVKTEPVASQESRSEPRTRSPERHTSRARSPERHVSRARSPERHVSRARSPERHVSRARSPERHASRARSPERHASRPLSPDRQHSSVSDTFGMDPNLAAEIDKINLGHYVGALAESGVCTIFDFRRLSDQDLRSLGVKPFHVTKLMSLSAKLIVDYNQKAEERKRKLGE